MCIYLYLDIIHYINENQAIVHTPEEVSHRGIDFMSGLDWGLLIGGDKDRKIMWEVGLEV